MGSYTIVLFDTSDDEDTPFEVVQIKDSSGVIIDNFNDDSLSGKDPPHDLLTYYVLLKDLRKLAYRKAIGAEKALDDLLKALKDGDNS